MRDIIERFRYRFELWHRERLEDLFGTPRTEPRESDPNYAAMLTESAPHFAWRLISVFVGVLLIAALIFTAVREQWPGLRQELTVGFAIFAAIWTVISVVSAIGFYRARRRHEREFQE